MKVDLKPIGKVINSDNPAKVKIFKKYIDGLTNIENYSHLVILYWLNKIAPEERLTIKLKPPYDFTPTLGVFATRFPARPNPIGLTIVKLIKREEDVLIVEDLDAEENTPIIDIKPYIPLYDKPKEKVILPKWVKKHVQEHHGKHHSHSAKEILSMVKKYYLTE